MRRTFVALVLAAAFCASLAAAVVIPPDGFAPGWRRSDELRTFGGSRLFDHIDGGAELYLEFGFKTLYVQRYAKGDDELTLEVYVMTAPESALGLYLMKCGRETPVPGIEARNSSEPAQFTILKGRHFLHVNNGSGREKLVPDMVALANRALNALPDEPAADLLSALPTDGLVPGSAFLFRGPVGLQSVFTLGEGDILDQRREVFGASGLYEDTVRGGYSLILVFYPDDARAAAAMARLISGLDPYLKILEKKAGGFMFEDFQKKYGLAELRSDRLEIRVGLSAPPLRSFSSAPGTIGSEAEPRSPPSF